jgi:AraC family transcriptional regulator
MIASRTQTRRHLDRPDEVTPADVSTYAPGDTWLNTTDRRSDPITMRGVCYKPSDIRVPAISAHALVLYRRGQTLITRRGLVGPTISEEVRPGDASLMASGQASEWTWPGHIDVLVLYIDRAKLEEVAGAVCDRAVKDAALRNILKVSDDLLTRMGQMLVDETRCDQLGSRLYLDAIMQQVCVHILRNYADLTVCSPSVSACFSKPMQRKLEEYVREHLAEDLSLDTLASFASVSPCYFSRLFRNSFGVPPYRYLLERRLTKARDLLRGKRHSIAEIAAMTGFSDQSHLTRLFKRQFDITPQLYRNG